MKDRATTNRGGRDRLSLRNQNAPRRVVILQHRFFGTAVDITLSEIALDMLFASDRETRDRIVHLTTDANAEVKAIHPKAMPVILTTPSEVETWLTAPWTEARALQRPLPNGALKVVAQGIKEEGLL